MVLIIFSELLILLFRIWFMLVISVCVFRFVLLVMVMMFLVSLCVNLGVDVNVLLLYLMFMVRFFRLVVSFFDRMEVVIRGMFFIVVVMLCVV